MPFSIVNPWLIVALMVTHVAAAGFGYLKGGQHAEAKHASQELLVAKAAEAAQSAAAQEIAKIEIRHTTIRQKVQRETIEKPVYRECVHSTDGLRLVNQALANGAEPTGDGKLPAKSRGSAR